MVLPERVSKRLSEQSLRASARATHQVALRRGQNLGMWIGCGYPKSGTVWLCQMMSTYLGLPYPRLYKAPIVMKSVVHAHWRYDPRLPSALYITRDGRDVLLSLYFYCARALKSSGKPRRADEVHETFVKLYGPAYDIDNVAENLPKFIEKQLTEPEWAEGLPWHQHVSEWVDRSNVGYVTYEGLLADPARELAGAVERVNGTRNDELAQLAARRWSFDVVAGRDPGVEDRRSFLRKGVAGDWKSYFGREAAEVFDSYAGDMLVKCGYETDRQWYWSIE